MIEEHGQRISTLEAGHRDMAQRVSVVDQHVMGLKEQLTSVIKEAAANQATMATKVDGIAAKLDGVQSTLDTEAGRRVGAIEAKAQIEAERAKAEAARADAEAKATSRVRAVVGFAFAAVPILSWIAVQFIEDVPQRVQVDGSVEMTRPTP